jgi:pimeloyl-ACP methyl ester carboxylesterase
MNLQDSAAGRQDQSQRGLPRGEIVRRTLEGEPDNEYFAYVPVALASGAPIFVSVHGISRGIFEQLRYFQEFCERCGVAMVAPHFTAERHGDYQRLGRSGRGPRADLLLDRYVAEVASLTGADATKLHLFGVSGGAQFVHRYLMAHPQKVACAVAVAAGWYTFPDTRIKFPYGIRPNRKLPGVAFDPERFLRVPVTVIVGEKDTGLDAVRRNERLDRQQGRNRVQRAREWVATMRVSAEIFGIEPCVRYLEIRGADHSFTDLCERGALPARVFHALFGTAGLLPEVGRTDAPNRARASAPETISRLSGDCGG